VEIMTDDQMRARLYRAYASDHAGVDDGVAVRLVARRDIVPHLPADRGARVVDVGCGQGGLVRELIRSGYHRAEGVDVSPEQVALAHVQGLSQVRLGDLHTLLAEGDATWDAVVATDVLEHLDKEEVLHTFDSVARGLRPGGVFIARVPNAGSPFGGSIRYGDFTHETWFTERSVRQLANASGFSEVTALPCRPIAHGFKSGLRVAVWRGFESAMRLAYGAETGVLRGAILTQNLTFVARMPV
jgi:2-polyprenyl-3-methyl-5-hydroxy-6-metoxy-1,4-benzoquinol methylase